MKKYLYRDLYELEDVHWWHIAKRKTCDELIRKYTKGENLRILDIGCGTGKNLEEFSEFGKTFGIDTSVHAIKFCKEKRGLKNLTFGSAEKTGFEKEQFDLVSMLDVLEHTDDARALKETFRILKKSGYFLITVPAYKWMWSQWDVVLHHKRRYTKGQIESLLKSAGFEIIKSTYLYSFLLLPVYVVRKIKKMFFKNIYPSDFKVGLPFVDKLLSFISDFERRIGLSFGIPFGLSIILIAKKVE